LWFGECFNFESSGASEEIVLSATRITILIGSSADYDDPEYDYDDGCLDVVGINIVLSNWKDRRGDSVEVNQRLLAEDTT